MTGVILDHAGTPLYGGTVVVASAALDVTETTLTDEVGCYFVGNLPAGTYEVTVFDADSRATLPATLGRGLHRIDGAVGALVQGDEVVPGR